MIPRLRPPFGLLDLATALASADVCSVSLFERRFAERFGFTDAVYFPYGRSGVHALLLALGMKSRSVLNPSYGCIVVPHAVLLSGNRVHFVDSTAEHFLPSAREWAGALMRETAVAVITPLFGYPVERAGIEAAIRECAPECFVLYDVAQGFDAFDERGSQLPGGHAALFSFGIGKMLSTLYGGMLTLRDARLAAGVRAMRDLYSPATRLHKFELLTYGIAVWAAFRQPMFAIADLLERRTNWLGRFTTEYYATDIPRLPRDFQVAPTPLQAALGLRQLARYETIATERARLGAIYEQRLRAGGVRTFAHAHRPTWSIYPLAVRQRERAVELLGQEGVQVGTLVNYACADLPGYEPWAGRCPYSSLWGASTINLPNWPGLGARAVEHIADRLLRLRDRHPDVFAWPGAQAAR